MLKHLPSDFSTFLDHVLTLDYYTKPDYEVGYFSFGHMNMLYIPLKLLNSDACFSSRSAPDVSV